jgi:hypothetical protein
MTARTRSNAVPAFSKAVGDAEGGSRGAECGLPIGRESTGPGEGGCKLALGSVQKRSEKGTKWCPLKAHFVLVALCFLFLKASLGLRGCPLGLAISAALRRFIRPNNDRQTYSEAWPISRAAVPTAGCEDHSDQPMGHDDCGGAGAQCPEPRCPFWQGDSPAALIFDRSHIYGLPATTCRIVQPYGRDVATQSTVISVHPTAVHAFAEIDRLAEQMNKTGAPFDAVELVVLDVHGKRVERPNRH